MYFDYTATPPNTLMQGDIIEKYPLSYIPKIEEYIFIRDNNGSPIILKNSQEGINQYNNELQEEQIVVNSKLNNIILLSQTCDLQRKKTVIIAPILDLDFLEKSLKENEPNEQKVKNKLNSLKARKFEDQMIPYFYLPTISSFPDRYIDFNLIQSVPIENIKIDNRILSFSDKGRHWLAYKLNAFFGRPIEF